LGRPQDLPPEHQPEQGDANTALALETEAYDERIGGFVSWECCGNLERRLY
jgi:hypothetical protein